MSLSKSPFSDLNDSIYYRPVIPLLFSFILGILAGRYFPGQSVCIIFAAVCAAAAIAYFFISGKTARISPLVLFACLGYLSFASWSIGSTNPGHVAHYADGRLLEISGTIASEPMIQEHRQKCILADIELSPVSGEAPPAAVDGNIQVTVYGKSKNLAIGDRLTLTSKIRTFHNFQNPGGFDYASYMMYQNVWGNAYTSDYKLKITHENKGSIFRKWLNSIRANISALIDQAATADAGGVLAALIIGSRTQISASLQNAFNRVGVTHILSISGLHISVVASTAFFLFKWMLSFFKPLLLRAWTKKGAALLSIFPVLIYGLLSGMEPATQRSVIMVSVFLLSFLMEKDHDLINTVCIAGMVILIFSPTSIFSISFQLSFIAVLSIILGMSAVKKQKATAAGLKTALRDQIYLIAMTSFFAIIGTLPVVMYYFNQMTLIGFFSNIILVPLMGFLAVIIGLFSVLVLYPVWTAAAVWGLYLCGKIIECSIHIIYFLSAFPFSAVKTVSPSLLEIACYYMLLWSLAALILPRMTGNLQRRPALTGNPAKFVLILVLIVMAADFFYWVHRRFFNDSFMVTILDVGQGNAAVLELPKGKCMIIDGGGFGDNSAFDVGQRVLAPFLWQNKIRTVDTVVLTHPDSDHLNGLVYILENFNVKQVFSTHQASDSASYQAFIELIRKNKIDHPAFKTIHDAVSINGATFNILYPPKDFNQDGNLAPSKDPNNNSLVIKAGFGRFTILFPGDIMQAAEHEICMTSAEALASTILIAPHHGSKTSSTPEFLDAVAPKAVIISSGKEDQFPAPSVLERYENRQYAIFRTDHEGALRIVSDGQTMAIRPTVGEKIQILN